MKQKKQLLKHNGSSLSCTILRPIVYAIIMFIMGYQFGVVKRGLTHYDNNHYYGTPPAPPLAHKAAATALQPNTNNDNSNNNEQSYTAGSLETYFREHHYNASGKEGTIFFQRGCPIWREEIASPMYNELQIYIEELKVYMDAIEKFKMSTISSTAVTLRDEILKNNPTMSREEICSKVNIHPKNGLNSIFKSGQLSYSPHSGYMEPLLPPLRHPLVCYTNNIYNYYLKAKHLLDLSYIVHDFNALCHKLQPNSRIVLIDMGASLQFHDEGYYSNGTDQSTLPAVYLTELFRKFGMPFDHIYAYEITETKPQTMVESIPEHLRAAYHWINVGVDPAPNSINNPLNLIHNHFNEDDVIIVKLDIDADRIEQQFIQQLLTDERFNITRLIDHFYFEHHLGDKYERKESIDLFARLRERGIPAHYWV